MTNNFNKSVNAFEEKGFPHHEARVQAKDAQKIQKNLDAGESVFAFTRNQIQEAVCNVDPEGFRGIGAV